MFKMSSITSFSQITRYQLIGENNFENNTANKFSRHQQKRISTLMLIINFLSVIDDIDYLLSKTLLNNCEINFYTARSFKLGITSNRGLNFYFCIIDSICYSGGNQENKDKIHLFLLKDQSLKK